MRNRDSLSGKLSRLAEDLGESDFQALNFTLGVPTVDEEGGDLPAHLDWVRASFTSHEVMRRLKSLEYYCEEYECEIYDVRQYTCFSRARARLETLKTWIEELPDGVSLHEASIRVQKQFFDQWDYFYNQSLEGGAQFVVDLPFESDHSKATHIPVRVFGVEGLNAFSDSWADAGIMSVPSVDTFLLSRRTRRTDLRRAFKPDFHIKGRVHGSTRRGYSLVSNRLTRSNPGTIPKNLMRDLIGKQVDQLDPLIKSLGIVWGE